MLQATENAHPLDQALVLEAGEQPGHWRGSTHPFYRNMVGPYGGVTAAQMLQAVMLDERRIGDPMSLTLHYAAPVADGDFQIQTDVKRSNRSTQHWAIEMVQQQGDGTVVVMTGMLISALRRETWGLQEMAMPLVAQPETLERFHKPQAPDWVNSFDMRYVQGDLNVRGKAQDQASLNRAIERFGLAEAKDSKSLLWFRDEPLRPLDFPGLASLCDIFFPRLLLRRPVWVPAGTISMTVYFHCSQPEIDAIGSDYLLGLAHGNRFHRGFFDQQAYLWSRQGALIASSQQMVYYKL
jgi:acyl-CoA thioesterase